MGDIGDCTPILSVGVLREILSGAQCNSVRISLHRTLEGPAHRLRPLGLVAGRCHFLATSGSRL